MNVRRILSLSVLAILALSCKEKTPAAHVRLVEKNVKLPFGRCVPVTLEWQMLRPLDRQDGKPVVFLHLLLPPHDVVRTFDHPFPADWRPGSKHTYQYDLCQSLDAPRINPGPYSFSAGLYDSADGERWPLSSDGREIGTFEYAVGDGQAVDEGEVVRGIKLEGDWGPLESAGDRQVVARRQFKKGASASILITNKVSDTLRVVLGVTEGEGSATVTNSCAPGWSQTFGRGFQTLQLPACAGGEIRIQRSGTSPISLDGLSWK
jgi:hypothetical protein